MKKEEERVKFRVVVVDKFPFSFEVKKKDSSVIAGEEEVIEVNR
jgi:hypothetical protein